MKIKHTRKDTENVSEKHGVDKNFTVTELNRFNELLVKYYPPEFDVYFMQGVAVGLYCTARPPLSPFFLDYKGNPLINCIRTFESAADYQELKELFDLMCIDCLNRLATVNTFSPLVSLNSMHTEYTSFMEYSQDELRNMLSWHLGFFLIYHLYFNLPLMLDYYNDTSRDDYDPDLKKHCESCVEILLELTKSLLNYFKPNFENEKLLITIDYLNSLSFRDKNHKFDMQRYPQRTFDALVGILYTTDCARIHHEQSIAQRYQYVNGSDAIH